MYEGSRRRSGRSRAYTRRDVLTLGGLGLAAASLSGCDLLSTDPSGRNDTGTGAGSASKGTEAPELATRVKQGKLPRLAKRLPEKPLMLEPREAPGRYGGELRMLGLNEVVDVNTTLGYENLVRWKSGIDTDLTADQVVPNVAEAVDVGADGREYTFRLRKGMKWSDGSPFTADDIMFWFDSVASNKELTPIPIDWLVAGKDPFTVRKVDDHTVVFSFSEPNGLFLVNLATQRGTPITDFPAHYLRKFHPDYVEDIDKLVKESKRPTWVDMFLNKANRSENAERPVIDAWQLTSAISASRRPVAVRNPYYWKTDPDGSQLPYLDRVAFDLVDKEEPAVLKATNGEFDLVDTGINLLRNKPVFARSREKAGYEFFETIPQQMNQMIIMLNLTHKDEKLRSIFTRKDFRVGLSHAINRQEIIDSVFQRQGEPWQAAPRPESPYYNEKLAKQFISYDPERANAYLDKVLPDKGSDGIRLRPDGEKLSFQVETVTIQPDLADGMELVRGYWRAVGIDMQVKSEDQALFFERMEANAHDACTWIGGGGLGATMDPFYYMPYNFNTRYAMSWFRWYNDPNDKRAEEPPEVPKRQVGLYRQLLTTADQQEQQDLMRQIIELAVDQFYCMGIALRKREYGLVNTKLRNAPQTAVTGWLHANLMPENPQLYFMDA
jgi:peptide/nickel transport system substrate-binding protein